MLMKTKKTYYLGFTTSKGCYYCRVHQTNYCKGELVSEIYHPTHYFDTLRDALDYFRSCWHVGYNRITFDSLDTFLHDI